MWCGPDLVGLMELDSGDQFAYEVFYTQSHRPSQIFFFILRVPLSEFLLSSYFSMRVSFSCLTKIQRAKVLNSSYLILEFHLTV